MPSTAGERNGRPRLDLRELDLREEQGVGQWRSCQAVSPDGTEFRSRGGGEGWGSGLSRVRLLRGFSKEDPHNNRRVDSGQERRRGT